MFKLCLFHSAAVSKLGEGRQGRDRMVVGFTTTYAISTYLH